MLILICRRYFENLSDRALSQMSTPSIIAWSHAHVAPKEPSQGLLAFISDFKGDLGHWHIGRLQQCLGTSYPDIELVTMWRHAR